MKIFSVRICAAFLILVLLFTAVGCTRRVTVSETAPEETASALTPSAESKETGPTSEETSESEEVPKETPAPEKLPEETSAQELSDETPAPEGFPEQEEEEKPAEPAVEAVPASASAAAEPIPSTPAQDITETSRLLKELWRNPWHIMYAASGEITDGDLYTGFDFKAEQVLEIHSDTPFRYIYVKWWDNPCPYYVKIGKTDFMTGNITYDEEKTQSCGGYEIIHDLIRLPEDATSAYIVTTGTARLCDIWIYTDGILPADVECWEPPASEADVLIFADYSGDETAYFGPAAALLADRDIVTQFCYLRDEFDLRQHERLSALWTLGVHRYPVFGSWPEVFLKSMDRAKEIYERDDLLEWQVSLLRQFRPLAVLGHDRQGENGDFTHILSASALEEAVVLSGDNSYKTGDAAPWEVPKLYLHMAEENAIILDVESPLSAFGGKTAVQMAKTALNVYARSAYEHRNLLDVSASPDAAVSAAEGRYDCRRFGLVRSLVGEDSGSDFLEHTENRR